MPRIVWRGYTWVYDSLACLGQWSSMESLVSVVSLLPGILLWRDEGDAWDAQIHVSAPDGEKHPLKVRRSDDVATLRALVTQMYDTADWTQVARRLSPLRTRRSAACSEAALALPGRFQIGERTEASTQTS
jgi:hypothetical protein